MSFESISQAAKWDITIEKGTTFSRTLEFEDLDISDYEFRGDIRRSFFTSEVEASFEFEKADDHTLKIELSASDTDELPNQTLFYDIEMYFTDDDDEERVKRILEGRISVKPGVTK